MNQSVKPFKTHAEQISILKSKGLIIEDEVLAEAALKNVNYYMLSGYLYPHKSKGHYSSDISFNEALNLYYFDTELRSVLLFAVNHIEQRLKSTIAYQIGLNYPNDPLVYENPQFFKDPNAHVKFMHSFTTFVNNNSTIPFVRHHINKYGGHFPIWVATELFTLGNIKFLYLNMPNKIRRAVSSQFNASPDVLDSWIENLRITRNMLAHDQKLYQTTWQLTPKLPKQFRPTTPIGNKLFAQIYLMKLMYPSQKLWNDAFRKIGQVLIDHNSEIELSEMGFPNDWQTLLK